MLISPLCLYIPLHHLHALPIPPSTIPDQLTQPPHPVTRSQTNSHRSTTDRESNPGDHQQSALHHNYFYISTLLDLPTLFFVLSNLRKQKFFHNGPC